MKIKHLKYKLLIFTLLCFGFISISQNIINGKITDYTSNEPLVGANVVIKVENIGTTTDFDGKFSIEFKKLPITIECSYIGYVSKNITINNSNSSLEIKLKQDEQILSDIEVTDNRLSEKLKQSPVTIESMDVIAIKETPASSFYEGLGSLKGVDLTSASLGFKIINTRGFNSTSPVRSLQIIDGVDNQSPGLNFSLGNFLGTTELDTKGVEIIVGANSSLYGPNAFNGVISMSTKDPFMFPGTSYQVKVGERSLNEHCFRYADNRKFKNGLEIGYKLNIQSMKANDWEANNYNASFDTESLENNPGGYDGVNIYGDEYNKSAEFNMYPGMGTVHRTGYLENQLADYDTENFKFNTAFHLRWPNESNSEYNNEIIYSFNLGSGTTIYQGDNRYSLKNIKFWQNKIEFKRNENFFVRFYSTHEDAGDSYDIVATAQALTNKSTSNRDWFWTSSSYSSFWSSEIIPMMQEDIQGFMTDDEWFAENGNLVGYEETMQELLSNYPDLINNYHQLARDYADNALGNSAYSYLEPNTPEFELEFENITSNTRYDEFGNLIGGTKFYDKSKLYHIQAEKKINSKFGNLTIGANGRLYSPDSRGSIFNDGYDYVDVVQLDEQGDTIFTVAPEANFENGVLVIDSIIQPLILKDTIKREILNYEFGAYLGYNKDFFGELISLNATARVDKNQNFDMLFSPAASIVYRPSEKDIIRLSFSSAIRNPTLTDQYLDYNAGPATLIGNLNGYGYDEYFVTIDAIIECLAAENTTLGNPNRAALKYGKLEIKPIKPENVKTIEIGYRTTILDKIFIDASYYYSSYKNFIGYQFGATYEIDDGATIIAEQEDVDLDWADYVGQEIDNYSSILAQTTRIMRVAANSSGKVQTHGFSAGLNYYLSKNIVINGNYSWNRLINERSNDELVPAFNTPEHKFNIGISNKFNLSKKQNQNYNISLNYKWIEGFLFEGSSQFTGPIESYGIIDGQINRDFKIKSYLNLNFKIGVSNLLNNSVYQVYGGPKIGRLTYLSLLINLD